MSRFDDGWRAAGLMMHISSLSSPYGIGDIGPQAHRLIPFLKKAGLAFWQILPISPTDPSLGNSPYSAYSAFAGHELLVSPEAMVQEGWISDLEAEGARQPNSSQVNFEKTIQLKTSLIDHAFQKAASSLNNHHDFQDFCYQNGTWLNDYAFFMAAKADFKGVAWSDWPADLKNREDRALSSHGLRLSADITRVKFGQYLFFRQLASLKRDLNDNGLGLVGDTAFYVNHDSSDVWASQYLFSLDENGRPKLLAGVPPDYFSQTGQLWGNPVFNWPAHQAQGHEWWKSRLLHNLRLFDWVRLDHFRAFAAFWAVPAGSETAATGYWLKGPGADLFRTFSQDRPLNIIAEDLGIITPDVTELRRSFQFPGMRVLQFGLGQDQPLSSHTPFRIEADNVVYAATHDNNTTRGWWRTEADAAARQRLSDISGYQVTEETAAWALIRLAWLSHGSMAMATMNDLLNLDEQHRLNTPGQALGNWGWRMTEPPSEDLAFKLGELTALSGRDNMVHQNILTY